MVRAAGQGHGRNDAATTDPQPRARCSSYAHDVMSVTRDSGSSSTRMFSSLLGSRTPHAGVFSIRIFSLGVAGRTEINWCHKPKQMSFLKISCMVSTSRKEITWCNKARARAKVWAQVSGAGPRAWGRLGPGPRAWHTCDY